MSVLFREDLWPLLIRYVILVIFFMVLFWNHLWTRFVLLFHNLWLRIDFISSGLIFSNYGRIRFPLVTSMFLDCLSL